MLRGPQCVTMGRDVTARPNADAHPRRLRWALGLLGAGLAACGGGGGSGPSSNNLLALLTTSLPVASNPAFQPSTTAYAIGPVVGATVVVTPTAEDPSATITVEGVAVPSGTESPPLSLGMGVTNLSTVVTAQDGSTRTYTLAVDRTSSDLTGLTASVGPLLPAFDPAVLAYTVGPALVPATTTLTPTAADPNATITVNTVATLSGSASADVPLGQGMTPVTVEVAARDGTTTSTYAVVFDRRQVYLKSADAEAGDAFGMSVALSGDTLVVGAPYEAGEGGAYVFTRTGTTWSPQAHLKASNIEASDAFGGSVAISGDTVVVGAYGEDGTAGGGEADNGAPQAGAAYVFTRTGTVWTQQAYLKASNAETWDWFGYSVALSGDTLVVGAWAEDGSVTGTENDNSADNAGAAYVFLRTGSTWSQQARLKASNAERGDYFGHSVAVSGDTAVVGAYGEAGGTGAETDNSAWGAGAAYVFTRTGGAWTQEAYLKASNAESLDSFGISLALSGDTLAVGAYSESSSAVGGPTDNSAYRAGAAYVFQRTGTLWSQQALLKASNAGVGDQFGRSVALSGDTLVVGAPSEDAGADGGEADDTASNAGAAYVFTRAGATWSQRTYLKASNAEAGDSFGISVAVSGDTVVVGAPSEDSSATGGGDDNSALESGVAYDFR